MEVLKLKEDPLGSELKVPKGSSWNFGGSSWNSRISLELSRASWIPGLSLWIPRPFFDRTPQLLLLKSCMTVYTLYKCTILAEFLYFWRVIRSIQGHAGFLSSALPSIKRRCYGPRVDRGWKTKKVGTWGRRMIRPLRALNLPSFQHPPTTLA